MKKIIAAKREYSEWCRAVGITNLSDLAKIIEAGEAISLINLCEARQERKYAEAADQIFWNRRKCRIVMMSGPSSSGKTSSSLRIAQQARVLGLNPKVIELDNYFVDRDRTPRDAQGNYDFEALEALDVAFLNEQLSALLKGEEVEIPKFDFKEGCRKGDPVLKEPIMKVDVIVPEEYMGDVMGDLNSRRGQIQGMEARPGAQAISAFVPLSEMFGYATDLRSKTQGRGQYTMQPSHYEEVPKSIMEDIINGRK